MSVFDIIPGQKTIDSQRTERMDIEKIEFVVGGVTLAADLLLPLNAPAHATPLIAAVRQGANLIWSFKSTQFDGRAHLVWINDQAVIAFVGRDSGAVDQITTLFSIVDGVQPGLKASVQLKYAAAEMLGVDHVTMTELEQKVAAKLDAERAARNKAELEARRADKQRQREERAAAREEKRQQITGRQQLKLQTSGGRILHGVPVVDDEWQCLNDGTWVTCVSSYHDGQVGDLIQHGVVSKKGGRVELKSITTDLQLAIRDQPEAIMAPAAVGSILLEIEEDVYDVSLYEAKDVEQIKKLGILGLFATRNGGELLVGRVVNVDGKILMKAVEATQFA